MERSSPYIRGWDSYEDGVQFGYGIPAHYGRRARLQFLRGWKDAKSDRRRVEALAA